MADVLSLTIGATEGGSNGDGSPGLQSHTFAGKEGKSSNISTMDYDSIKMTIPQRPGFLDLNRFDGGGSTATGYGKSECKVFGSDGTLIGTYDKNTEFEITPEIKRKYSYLYVQMYFRAIVVSLNQPDDVGSWTLRWSSPATTITLKPTVKYYPITYNGNRVHEIMVKGAIIDGLKINGETKVKTE